MNGDAIRYVKQWGWTGAFMLWPFVIGLPLANSYQFLVSGSFFIAPGEIMVLGLLIFRQGFARSLLAVLSYLGMLGMTTTIFSCIFYQVPAVSFTPYTNAIGVFLAIYCLFLGLLVTSLRALKRSLPDETWGHFAGIIPLFVARAVLFFYTVISRG